MNKILLSVALSALAVPALAQQGSMVEVSDETMVPGFQFNADVMGDMDVYSGDGQKIGEVEDVVGPDRKTPQGIAVDFEDSLSQYGRAERIVPLDQFSFADSHLILKADPKAISSMPVWAD